MEAIVDRCCGLDVHQAVILACVLVGAPHEKPRKVVKKFGATTRELEALRDWLLAEGCTHVGMEATGIYWEPVYNVLEGHFSLVVGNAHHIAKVPGRKTDATDAEWIADLLRHGLIRPSFVPPRPIRELRLVVRTRNQVIRSQTAERNRTLKLLEVGNIKLSGVATDPFGKSGMLMLQALAAGEASAAASRWLFPSSHFCRRISFASRMGTLSVAIAPPARRPTASNDCPASLSCRSARPALGPADYLNPASPSTRRSPRRGDRDGPESVIGMLRNR